jgi:hypothetical protein
VVVTSGGKVETPASGVVRLMGCTSVATGKPPKSMFFSLNLWHSQPAGSTSYINLLCEILDKVASRTNTAGKLSISSSMPLG